jgi:uncharacterized protein YndB with AHSA1/START domain
MVNGSFIREGHGFGSIRSICERPEGLSFWDALTWTYEQKSLDCHKRAHSKPIKPEFASSTARAMGKLCKQLTTDRWSPKMQYAFTLTTTIPASAQEIYEAWLDSLAHSEMTGSEAIMSDEVGAEVAAWDGYITGRNLELVPGERIVQSWRTNEFTDQHEDSIITLTLEEVADGTLLTLVHSKVPQEQTSYERGGWQVHYFEPMNEYFAKRKKAGGRKAKVAVPKTKAKAKAKPKTKRVAKSKPATSKAKARSKKSKRVVAKAKPKRAKKAKRKAVKSKPRR